MLINSIQSLNVKDLDPEKDVIVVGVNPMNYPPNVRRKMIDNYKKQFTHVLPNFKIIILETGEHPPLIQPTTRVDMDLDEMECEHALYTNDAIETVATSEDDEKLVDDIVNSADTETSVTPIKRKV